MTIAPNPNYRNIRKNFYTDKASDTTEIGTIISTMKAVTDIHDNSFIPIAPSYDFATGQITRKLLVMLRHQLIQSISILGTYIVMDQNIK